MLQSSDLFVFVCVGQQQPWRIQDRWAQTQEREDGWRRRGDKQWALVHDSVSLEALITQCGGRGGGITICLTITDPQLILITMEVTIASLQPPPIPCLLSFHMAEDEPVWPPHPPTGEEYSNCTSSPFHILFNGRQMLVLRADTPLF